MVAAYGRAAVVVAAALAGGPERGDGHGIRPASRSPDSGGAPAVATELLIRQIIRKLQSRANAEPERLKAAMKGRSGALSRWLGRTGLDSKLGLRRLTTPQGQALRA